jgi:hypothetical protein
VERQPHDVLLLRQAMRTAIGQRLKAECGPPTDLTPELREMLKRLEERKGSNGPNLSPLVFLAGMIALASSLLGGVYLLFRREPIPDKKTPKKIIVSNVR